jgi:HK97 family phage major capsid protein
MPLDIELKTALDSIGSTVQEFKAQQNALQKQVDSIDLSLKDRVGGGGGGVDVLQKAFEESAELARMREVGKGRAVIKIGDLNQIPMQHKLLTGADITGTSGVIAPERVGPIVPLAQRRLFMRDLLYRGGRVNGSSIYFIRENTFVNNASPQAGEGGLKNETTNTFTTTQLPIQTLQHYLVASRQLLDDAPALAAYVKNKLLFGLRFREDVQILSGDGTGNNLAGLIPAATSFNTSLRGSSFTKLDILRRALEQVELADEVPAGFFVMNPADWADIELIKDSQNRYIYGDPGASNAANLWGRPTVVSTAIASGAFLCGSSESAELFDRMDATVEASFEERENFIRNQVTLLCEERTVLAIYHPSAFVYGALTSSPA